MHNVYAIRILVDGLTMGYTHRRDSSHDLDLRWMGQLITNLRALGHDSIVVEFRNEMGGRMSGMEWYIAENIDGTVWLNFYT